MPQYKHSKNAETVAAWLKGQIDKYGSSDIRALPHNVIVMGMTTDTTNVMPATVAYYGADWNPCIAHTLNLVLNDLLTGSHAGNWWLTKAIVRTVRTVMTKATKGKFAENLRLFQAQNGMKVLSALVPPDHRWQYIEQTVMNTC